MMDENRLAIKPIKAEEAEKHGINPQLPGQRRCIIVVPNTAAPGKPWSWRGFFLGHPPSTEIEVLEQGFFLRFGQSRATLKQSPTWGSCYGFLQGENRPSRPLHLLCS